MLGFTRPSHVPASGIQPTFWKDPWVLTLAAVLLLISAIAVVHPEGNYDGVFYTALVSGAHTEVEQQQAGLTFEKALPEKDVKSAYRDDMRSNASHFQQQLPFYSVKPLYVFLLWLVRHSGSGLRAGALISAASYIALGLVTTKWLKNYYSGFIAVLFAALLMLNPTIARLIRWTSPDLLSTLIAVAAIYLILETDRILPGSLLLVVDIWVRPEGIIFAGLCFCALYLAKRFNLVQTTIFSFMALGSYAFVTRHGYSFSILFYHSLIARLTAPAEAHIVLTRGMYFGALWPMAQELMVRTPYLSLPFLLCVVIFTLSRGKRLWFYISAAAVLSSLILLLAYPNFEARYYLASMVFIPILVLLARISAVQRTAAVSDSQA